MTIMQRTCPRSLRALSRPPWTWTPACLPAATRGFAISLLRRELLSSSLPSTRYLGQPHDLEFYAVHGLSYLLYIKPSPQRALSFSLCKPNER